MKKLRKETLVQKTFGDVRPKEPLLYINSQSNLAVALREDNFAGRFKISSGPEWQIELSSE